MSKLCSLFPSSSSIPASLPVLNGVMPLPVCKLLVCILGGSVIFSIIARIAFSTFKVNGFLLLCKCTVCHAMLLMVEWCH